MTYKVELNEQIRECDHCGAKNIKRTFHIYNENLEFYIGRVCVERLTGVSTSGNPYKAVERVQKYLDKYDLEPIHDFELIDD